MKQKLTLGLAAVTTALGVGALAIPLSPNGFAEAPDCSAVADQTRLTVCIEANESITLGDDIELSSVVTIKGGYDAKINLNNHTITRNANSAAFQIRQGRLVLEGNGTVERFGLNSANSRPTIRIYGSTEEQTIPYSSLVVGENVTISNNDDAAIGIDGNDGTGAFHGINVSFKGKAYARYGIRVAKDINNYDGMPTIEIADGAMINAETGIETNAPGQAIRAEGPAKWNIGKASIIGDTGIALRAGEFHLNGPTVVATGPEEAPVHEFSTDKSTDKYCGYGIETEFCEKFLGTGSAIQIQEEQTESEDGINGIKIFINDGTFESKHGYAISEYKERAENPDPTELTDTLKTLEITEGNLIAFSDITETEKQTLKDETRYTLAMVTDDFFWRYGDGRMCADGSASIKSYDEDWLRTNFIVRQFNEGQIGGLDKIYADLPWIERLLVDYTSFPGPYNQYDFTDAENVALDEYAISKGIDYDDIKIPLLFQLDLFRFEKDNVDFDSIEGEEGYFRGSLTTPNAFDNAPVSGSHSVYPGGKGNPLTGGTSKPYMVIHDTEDYPLTFTMKLPENLPAVEDGYVRTYSVLDLHCTPGGSTYGEEEKCEAIELPIEFTEDGTSYSFTTTKFSAFILTYNDELAPEPTPEPESPTSVPDTGYTEQGTPNSSSDQAIIVTIAAILISTGLLVAKKMRN